MCNEVTTTIWGANSEGERPLEGFYWPGQHRKKQSLSYRVSFESEKKKKLVSVG